MRKLKINKQGEVVGIGAFGGKNPEYTYIRVPNSYTLDELKDEAGKPLYKYSGMSVQVVKDEMGDYEKAEVVVVANDRADTPEEERKRKELDFRKQYPTEERLRLQDEAIMALAEGRQVPIEYSNYIKMRDEVDGTRV